MQNSNPLAERVGVLDARLDELEARVRLIEGAPPTVAPRAEAAPRFDPLLLPAPRPTSAPPRAPEITTPSTFAPPLVVPPSAKPPSAKPPSATPPNATPGATPPDAKPPDATLPGATPPNAASSATTPTASAPTASAPNASAPTAAVSATAPAQAPKQAAVESPESRDALLDWEQLVGGKWALWAGLLSLFCAMASFLAYSWRFLPPPPPGAKVAMGLGAALLFLGAGEWMRSRAQRWFGEGLSGAGLALGFLSLWAGAAYFSIFPVAPTFVAMSLVVALGVWLAVRYDALGLHILSVIGGFATPLLLHGPSAGGASVSLLVYLAILNAGVLGVSLFKRWRVSTGLAGAMTVISLAVWSLDAPIGSMRLAVWAFYSFYFLLYLGASCFYSLARGEETQPADVTLLVGASALYAVCGQDLLRPLLGQFPGAFALGLAIFLGAVSVLAARCAPANRLLRQSLGALGVLALTVAVPLQWGQPWLGIAWAGEAGVLLWLSRRAKSAFLARAGRMVWTTSLLPLAWGLLDNEPVRWGLHAGGWPWLFGLTLSVWHACASRRVGETGEWKDVFALSGLFGGAYLVGREVALRAGEPGQIWLITLALSFYAVGVFAVGAGTRFASVRLGATTLAAGAAATALWWTSGHLAFDLTPFWNVRWASVCGTLGALGAIYVLARWVDFPLHPAEKELAGAWPWGALGYGLAAFSVELYLGFGHFGAPDWAARAFFALAIVWSGVALGLLWRGLRARSEAARVAAYFVGAVAVAALGLNALGSDVGWLPFWSWRGGAFVAAIMVLGVAAFWLRRAGQAGELADWEGEWPTIFAGMALVLTLWMLTQETWAAGRYFAPVGGDWQRGAQLAISLVWSLFGALLLLGGIGWRAQIARVGALALLAATVCKVFLFDLSFLSGDLRPLSLGGLGVALVFISGLYGRFGRAGARE